MTDGHSPLGRPQGKINPDTGLWERTQYVDGGFDFRNGNSFSLKIPITYALADAAVLFTTPRGQRLLLEQLFWEITTGFAGGSSSAIGISASVAPHTTKGDLLGGAAGDVAATLVAGIVRGTLGVSLSATPYLIVLEPETDVRFDRITSAYTSGAGYLHIGGKVLD